MNGPVLTLLTAIVAALMGLGVAGALWPRPVGAAIGYASAGLAGLAALLALAALLLDGPPAMLALPIGLPGAGFRLGLDALTNYFVLLVFGAGAAAGAFAAGTVAGRPMAGARSRHVTAQAGAGRSDAATGVGPAGIAALPICLAGLGLAVLGVDAVARAFGLALAGAAIWALGPADRAGAAVVGVGLLAAAAVIVGAAAPPPVSLLAVLLGPGALAVLAPLHGWLRAPPRAGAASEAATGGAAAGPGGAGIATARLDGAGPGAAAGLAAASLAAAGAPAASSGAAVAASAAASAGASAGTAGYAASYGYAGGSGSPGSAVFADSAAASVSSSAAGGIAALAPALLAGTMLPVAVDVALRLLFDPATTAAPPIWWGLPLLCLGALAALGGGLATTRRAELEQALGGAALRQSGLTAIGLGLALIARAADLPGVTAMALGAVLLLAALQAVCGTLLPLVGAAIRQGAGTRRLDRLGGLVHRMPTSTACLIAGLFGLAALPPGAGFAAIWLLLQTLLALPRAGGAAFQLLLCFLAAVLGVVAALGSAGLLRLVGVVCLGRPRTPRAAAADEASSPARRTMLALAGIAVLLGVFVGPALRGLAGPAIRGLTGTGLASRASLLGLAPGAESPGYAALPIASLLLLVVGVVLWLRRLAGVPSGVVSGPAWEDGFAASPAWLPFGNPVTQTAGSGFAPAMFGGDAGAGGEARGARVAAVAAAWRALIATALSFGPRAALRLRGHPAGHPGAGHPLLGHPASGSPLLGQPGFGYALHGGALGRAPTDGRRLEGPLPPGPRRDDPPLPGQRPQGPRPSGLRPGSVARHWRGLAGPAAPAVVLVLMAALLALSAWAGAS